MQVSHFSRLMALTVWVLLTQTLVACASQPAVGPSQAAPANDNTAVPASSQPQPEPATTQASATPPAPAKVAVEPDLAKKTDLTPEILFHLMIAEVAGQRGHINVAVQQYLEAAKSSRDPKVIERAARIAVYARDDASAMQAAELWTEVEPMNAEAHQVAAAMYVRTGKTKQAHSHLEKVINLSANNEHNIFMLITSLLGKERDKQTALDVMQGLIATRQDNPEALYAYAQLALLVGELDIAIATAKDVIKLRPNWADAHILNSSALHRQGKKVQSMAELKEAVNELPANVTLRDYYARRLVDEKRYEEAQKQFEALLVHAPGNSEAIYAMGLLSLQTRDLDNSEKIFKRLVKDGKRVQESSYYLGQIAEQQEKPAAAIEWYKHIVSGQYYIDAQVRIAIIDANDGKLEQARQRLSGITPENVEAEQRLILAEGEILRTAKMYQESFDLYNEGLARLPDNISILYARALTAEKIERIDVTLADLEKILSLEPDNAQALNALGYTMVDKTDRTAEGLKLIEKAYQIQPDDAAIMDSMGWANYRLGNLSQALLYLRKAFATLKDAEIAAHLGEVLWVKGDHDEARTVWDEALRETPSHKLLLDVIKRFTK